MWNRSSDSFSTVIAFACVGIKKSTFADGKVDSPDANTYATIAPTIQTAATIQRQRTIARAAVSASEPSDGAIAGNLIGRRGSGRARAQPCAHGSCQLRELSAGQPDRCEAIDFVELVPAAVADGLVDEVADDVCRLALPKADGSRTVDEREHAMEPDALGERGPWAGRCPEVVCVLHLVDGDDERHVSKVGRRHRAVIGDRPYV